MKSETNNFFWVFDFLKKSASKSGGFFDYWLASLFIGFFAFIFLFFIGVNSALAGFGITPPYLKNDNLTRNSSFEQKILLVRSDPLEDWQAKITINVPGAENWISLDKGTEFILPKNETQIPLVFKVRVPENAAFGDYKGKIRVVVSPLTEVRPGVVSIVLGAQIDVNFKVSDRKIFDFRIARVGVSDLEEGRKFWWLYFPGKIRFSIFIENTGNVPAAPTAVEFNIFDRKGNLAEKTKNTNKIRLIKPFESGEVIAELPTRLKPGSYSAKYFIYKKEEVSQEGEINLSILPKGTLAAYQGYGWSGLTLWEKITVLGPVSLILGALVYFTRRQWLKLWFFRFLRRIFKRK